MVQSTRHLLQHGALFGPGETPVKPAPKADLATQLSDRLVEKYRNYERAAARLELRGESDAAEVLRKAAARLRKIRNCPQSEDGIE